jgi:UTP:GlnB (protein PII) uridylyltransferase
MQTFAKPVALVLVLAPLLPACALFGIKQQRDQQAAYEEQVKQQQAQAAVQMKEAERQVKIAEARTAYLEQELDAQQYSIDCAALSAEIEKVIVKMGRSVHEHGAELIVTDWSHVQARYEETYDYRIRQTRAASKSRYVAELVPASDGTACKVKATFQYSDENGAEASDRALDLEARVLEQVEPERYAKIEAEFKAIEQKYPAG